MQLSPNEWSVFMRAIALACLIIMFVSPQAAADSGRLIEAKPASDAPAGAIAWRILYETSDKDGRPTQSTALLIAPNTPAPPGGRPVVAWAHGTTGIAEECAPSLGPHAFSSIPGLMQMLRDGWVVVATDYPGLGTSGPHAYLVGNAAGYAVLDSVRAARRVPRVGAGSRFAVWGLSQGAHAALFTGQVAGRYAPDLQLAGVVAAAPPTNLASNLGGDVNPSVRTMLTALATASWSKVYNISLATIAKPAGQRVIGRLAQTCGSEDPALRTKIQVLRLRRQLGNTDLSRIEPWRKLLAVNSAGHSPAGAPLFVAQGGGDKVVSPNMTRQFADDACRRGEKITFVELPGVVHADTAKASANQASSWMKDRFAGIPAKTTCRGY